MPSVERIGCREPAPPARAKPRPEWSEATRRDPFIDALRGLCLFVMANDHLGGPLHRLTWQSLGFVSAAEGFIFLSGLVTGLVLGRPRGGAAPMSLHAWARVRAWRVYRAHVMTLALVTALLPLVSAVAPGESGAWPGPSQQLLETPLLAIAGGALFIVVPPPFDVLPLYVAFLLSAPFVVERCERGQARRVAGISVVLWLLSQATMGRMLHWAGRLFPGSDAPDFDVFGWQLLFVAGVMSGWAAATGRLEKRPSRLTWVFAGGLAVALFLSRHLLAEDGLLSLLAGRPALGPVRVLNFGLIAMLTWVLPRQVKQVVALRPLVDAGRHSLLVFSLQVGLAVLIVPFRGFVAPLGPAADVTMSVLCIGALFAVPWLLERHRGGGGIGESPPADDLPESPTPEAVQAPGRAAQDGRLPDHGCSG